MDKNAHRGPCDLSVGATDIGTNEWTSGSGSGKLKFHLQEMGERVGSSGLF